jgi:hypothetical protein
VESPSPPPHHRTPFRPIGVGGSAVRLLLLFLHLPIPSSTLPFRLGVGLGSQAPLRIGLGLGVEVGTLYRYPPSMSCMQKSPTDSPKDPSGCGQRWGSGGTEGQTGTETSTDKEKSPSRPGLCRLPLPGAPSVPMIPKGEDAGKAVDPPGGGSPRDAKAIPLHVSTYKTPLTPSTLLVALSSPHIPDSGASHILLRASSLPDIAHLFTPSRVPPITLSQANGAPLVASHGGTLSFPSRAPILTYILLPCDLAHNLWSVSALIGTNGCAIFTPTSVSFFYPSSPLPFLTGTKQATDTLWALSIPSPSVSLVPSPTSLVVSPCMHAQYGTGAPYNILVGFWSDFGRILVGFWYRRRATRREKKRRHKKIELSKIIFPVVFPPLPYLALLMFLRHCPSFLPYLALLMSPMLSLSCILTGPLALLSCLPFSLPFVPAG